MNLFDKILHFFGSKISERDKYRIDTTQIDNLNIEVFNKSYQINDISLEGISFLLDEKAFELKENQNAQATLYFKENKLQIKLIIKRVEKSRVSCQVLEPLNEYKDFLTENLIYIIPMQY